MKKVILIVILGLICTRVTFAEGLLLKGDMDPREVSMPRGFKLWSDIQAEKIRSRPMREEVMTSASLYLESRISLADFVQFLKSWADLGFNQQERIVLTDTVQKSNMPVNLKNQWLCRLDSERNCQRIKLIPKHLSPILQKYDWVVIDGQVYPRMSWDEISITDENMTWTFLSSRFETYNFKGKWEDLKFKNPNLVDWVTGTCERFVVQPTVQDLDTSVLVNRGCLKSSLVVPKSEPSFYEQNKNKIWIAAGLALGASVAGNLSGKKIILEKPSFR